MLGVGPASGVADHAAHLGYDLPGLERLAEKLAAGRRIGARRVQLPRHRDDLDRRPTLMHGMRETQAVHTARQLNVGAHERDVGLGFQDCDSFVGIQASTGV